MKNDFVQKFQSLWLNLTIESRKIYFYFLFLCPVVSVSKINTVYSETARSECFARGHIDCQCLKSFFPAWFSLGHHCPLVVFSVTFFLVLTFDLVLCSGHKFRETWHLWLTWSIRRKIRRYFSGQQQRPRHGCPVWSSLTGRKSVSVYVVTEIITQEMCH